MIFKETLLVIFLFHLAVCQTGKESNKNYYLVNEKVNFYQAYVNCQAGGMELANVLSVDEQADLTYLLDPVDKKGSAYGGFWLSGTNLAQQNTTNYYWLTGGKRVLYTNWLPNEPNNYLGNERCLQYAQNEANGEEGWNDLDCQVNLRYICQDKTCC